MSPDSRRLEGIMLVVLPTVVYGGVSLLIVLSLVLLPYAEEANLPRALKLVARYATPAAALLLPAAFFLSVASPRATHPNGMINLAYLGAAVLVIGLITLGVGLLRRPSVRA